MILDNWAQRWNIPAAAMDELKREMGLIDTRDTDSGMSESSVQQRVRLKSSQNGWRLFRNNCGGFKADTGQFVRYGLANDSAAMSKKLKSSDLIGIIPYIVRLEDIGKTLGLFCSLEVKKSKWKYTGTAREVAQLTWINLINSLGGYAKFINNEDQL